MSDTRSNRSYCKGCGHEILWVETQNGKRMPLDTLPEKRFVLDALTQPMSARQRNVYTCHLETCTNPVPHG